jgi:hypothetical protein
VKVHVGGKTVHTGQLYFDDGVNAVVYGKRTPYTERGPKEMTNEQDQVYASGGRQSTLRIAKSGSGYVGRLAMGVRA